ncbi:MAG: aldo/keto reductase [Lachnospiraceae bacterium]|nr:aldo/keto reductase [Lachnospiraceae bacterium]
MQYRTDQRNNNELSVLGFGCMRFTKKGGSFDQEKAFRELARAVELGVNYFDTAYAYAGSEVLLGRFLKEYGCRDRINIATKLPQYRIKKGEEFDSYFNEELERLMTDHVDYYLLHMLNDVKSFERLCSLGLKEWIRAKKASGQIRNMGFSFHGGTLAFKDLLDAYDWDFCQIQFNYMDEHTQAGIDGLNYAHEKGIPVIIMEPLRGGRLVNALPKDALMEFENMSIKRSPAEWGLRWVWNHPQVNVVLSGMNDITQVEENCRIASESLPDSLSEEELALYGRVLTAILHDIKVGCTGCGYCQPCPRNVDIPTCFSTLNASYSDNYANSFREYFMCTTLRKDRTNAGLCIKCGKCEQHCPQSIKIRDMLDLVKRRFENPVYKIAAAGSKLIMRY